MTSLEPRWLHAPTRRNIPLHLFYCGLTSGRRPTNNIQLGGCCSLLVCIYLFAGTGNSKYCKIVISLASLVSCHLQARWLWTRLVVMVTLNGDLFDTKLVVSHKSDVLKPLFEGIQPKEEVDLVMTPRLDFTPQEMPVPFEVQPFRPHCVATHPTCIRPIGYSLLAWLQTSWWWNQVSNLYAVPVTLSIWIRHLGWSLII